MFWFKFCFCLPDDDDNKEEFNSSSHIVPIEVEGNGKCRYFVSISLYLILYNIGHWLIDSCIDNDGMVPDLNLIQQENEGITLNTLLCTDTINIWNWAMRFNLVVKACCWSGWWDAIFCWKWPHNYGQ